MWWIVFVLLISARYEVLASSVATETAMKRIINNAIAVYKLSICLSNANKIKVPIIEMTILHLIAIFSSPLTLFSTPDYK